MKTYIIKFKTGEDERTMRVMNCINDNHAKAKLCEYVMKKENLVPVITALYAEHPTDPFEMLNKIVNGGF
jgi:hypothetical protein